MARQYLVPGIGYVNETGTADYLIPGSAYIDETQASAASASLGGVRRRRVYSQSKPPTGWQLDRSHPLSQGLARMFAFNEAGGATLFDSATGLALATSNAPAWGAGPHGPKLAYNGTNQQATGSDNGLPSGTNPVTIAVLFRTTSASSNMCLLGYGDTSANNQNFHVLASGGNLKIGAINGDLAGTATVNDGKWHVGVGIFAGGNVYSYVDGVPDLAPTARANSTVLAGASGVYSGQLGTLSIWADAEVGGAWIWNRALSAAEVQQHAARPFANFAPQRRTLSAPALPAVGGARRKRFYASNKPPVAAQLDRGHPLSQGLIRAFHMTEGGGASTVDSTGLGKPGALTGSYAWKSGSQGPALSLTSTAKLDLQTGAGFGTLVGQSKYTVVIRFYTNSATARGCMMADFNSGATGNSWDLEINCFSLASGHLGLIQNDGVSNNFVDSNVVLTNGRWYTAAIRWDGATVTIWMDGVQTGSQAVSALSTGDTLTIGSAGAFSGLQFNGGVEFCHIYKRVLNSAEIQQYSAQPYANFAPQRQTLLAGAAATANFTGTAAITEAADTASASGLETFTGTGPVTETADAVTASGLETFTGTASPAETADTASATGKENFTGTAAPSETADTANASGLETFTGTAPIAEGADTANASGTTGSGFIASAATTEAADTATASGAETFTGSSATAEAADTAAATASLTFTGTAAITESADTASSAAILNFTGTSSSSETADSASAIGLSRFLGTASITEGADTTTASGSGPTVSTPQRRTYRVAAENRTYRVAA